MKENKTRIIDFFKSGFFKGVGIGAGLLTTSVFAAAAAMNIFSPGQTISSAQINENFAIAAPEGAVMAFYLADCPNGWAVADGTNGTPDLRGRFIRGLDLGAGVDPDSGTRTLGSLQADAFQGHYHNRNSFNGTEQVLRTETGSAFMFGGGPHHIIYLSTTGRVVDDPSYGPARVGDETRPTNVALIYCMRKN